MKIALIITLIAIAIAWSVYTGDVPKKYRLRTCTGKSWKARFPDASKQDIRKFLVLLVDAFTFSRNQKLKFEPEDRILDIYRSIYPMEGMPDAFELETLEKDIDNEYGVCLKEIWREDLTLGELFAKIKNA